MDECDMASAAADKYLKHTLADQKARVHSSRASRKDCLDCGENIPEARRKAVQGCLRCIQCETEFERRHSGS